MVLEIMFIQIRENTDIKSIDIFGSCCKFTAFADDSTFFLRNKLSIELLLQVFGIFSEYAGLKLNTAKCKITGKVLIQKLRVALAKVEKEVIRRNVRKMGRN